MLLALERVTPDMIERYKEDKAFTLDDAIAFEAHGLGSVMPVRSDFSFPRGLGIWQRYYENIWCRISAAGVGSDHWQPVRHTLRIIGSHRDSGNRDDVVCNGFATGVEKTKIF